MLGFYKNNNVLGLQLLRLVNVIVFVEKANGHMFYYLSRTSACYELYRRIIESHFPEEVAVQGSNKKMQKWLKADIRVSPAWDL